MDCEAVRQRIFSFLDGESPGEDIGALEEHFEACFPCYQRLVLQRALGKVVRARTHGRSLPDGLEKRLRGEIGDRARSQGRPPLLDRPLVWLFTAAAVFLAVGLTAALSVSRQAEPVDGPVRTLALGEVDWSDEEASPSASPAVPAGAGGHGIPSGESVSVITLEGVILCFGCVAEKSGVKPCPHVHQNGIRTTDGRFWHLLETETTRKLIHGAEYQGRRARIQGAVLQSADLVVVEKVHLD